MSGHPDSPGPDARVEGSVSRATAASRLRAVAVLDWLVLVVALFAVWVDVTGGFYVSYGGVRLSAQRTDRVVLTGLALLLVRLALGRGIGPLARRFAPLRWWPGPLFDRAADLLVARDGRGEELRRFLLAVLGFVVLGAVLLRTQLAHMNSVPDIGDPLFSIWRMGWVFHQLGGDPRPLFDANIFYPELRTLTYSDSMLLPALMGAPLLAAGIHPVVAYNLLFLSGFLLSAITTYLLIVRLTGSAQAAFIGGLLYGFYPYRFEHYSHLELQMTFWMPLALLAIQRFSETLRPRYFIVLGLCGVAQLYSSMYYGVFFPLYAAAVLGTLLLAVRAPWRRLVGPVVLTALVAAILALPLARPYFAAQQAKGERDENTVTFYSATLSDYFRAHPRSAVYGGRLLADEYPERALFPGVTPLALSLVGLVPPLGATRLAYFAGLAFSFDLSRGFHGAVYSYLYEWLSPVRGMRVPARASAILAISLAVLGAFGARRLLDRSRSAHVRRMVFAALVLGVAVDLHPALTLVPVWPAPPPIYGAIADDPSAILADFPFTTDVPDIPNSIPYMYFSLWHWRPIINGYSGFSTA